MTDTRTRDPHARFVRLARVGDLATASLLAARLRAEGIEVRVHGQALGPYPMTVGEMAATELWVLDADVPEASRILLDAEIKDVLERPQVDGGPDRAPAWWFRLAAVVIGGVFLILWLLRVVEAF